MHNRNMLPYVMTTPANAPPTQAPGIDHRVFLWNFITALLAGSGVCAWAGYYSDRLPEISAVLGGGGILVWAATASLLVGQERQDAFRGWVIAKVISRR